MRYDQEVVDRIVAYLERHAGEWVPEDRLEMLMSQAVISDQKAMSALRRVRSLANIGSIWNGEKRCMVYRWYERKNTDDITQRALDEF